MSSENRRGERWRVRGVDDPAGLPLLVALFAVFFFVLTPINNTIIRVNEVEADIFGLNAARQPDGFAEAALLLGHEAIDPGPVRLRDAPPAEKHVYPPTSGTSFRNVTVVSGLISISSSSSSTCLSSTSKMNPLL